MRRRLIQYTYIQTPKQKMLDPTIKKVKFVDFEGLISVKVSPSHCLIETLQILGFQLAGDVHLHFSLEETVTKNLDNVIHLTKLLLQPSRVYIIRGTYYFESLIMHHHLFDIYCRQSTPDNIMFIHFTDHMTY